MELFHANQQWSTRPADERFTSLEAMHTATLEYANSAREKSVPWNDLRVEAVGQDLSLIGRAGVPAQLTNYAFGQLSARIGAPAGYLRQLPATLAAQNLNHGLKEKGSDNAQLLFHQNGGLLLRAATSDKYARIWNHEVIARLIEMSNRNFLVPARATIRATSFGQTGEERALFASDHDMFAFMMSPEHCIVDPMGQGLYRGIIVINSEVGAAALKVMAFYFRDICGNFIIWGAEQIAEISLRHVGDIRRGWQNAQVSVRRYLDGAASLETAKFNEMTRVIAGTKEQVLDKVFGLRINELSRKAIGEAYDAVVVDEDGAPNSVWGLAQGVTRISQQETFADERHKLDKGAGKLLAAAFRF
jgi:hypothetical protein